MNIVLKNSSQAMRITFGVTKFFWALRIIFDRLRITFQMYLPTQKFPFFRQILCKRCKNANKLRIMICNCELLCQSVSPFKKKWRIIFRFLNPVLPLMYFQAVSLILSGCALCIVRLYSLHCQAVL